VLAKAAATVTEAQGKQVKSVADFRRALDDKSIDALVIAAPDSLARAARHPRNVGRKHV